MPLHAPNRASRRAAVRAFMKLPRKDLSRKCSEDRFCGSLPRLATYLFPLAKRRSSRSLDPFSTDRERQVVAHAGRFRCQSSLKAGNMLNRFTAVTLSLVYFSAKMRYAILAAAAAAIAPVAHAAFGYTSSGGYWTVDAGSDNPFVFKVSQSSCDITSLVYRSVEVSH